MTNLNLSVNNINITSKAITADINNFSLNKKSGFILKKLAAKFNLTDKTISAKDIILNTNRSQIALNVELNFDKPEDLNDFINKVNINTYFKPSTKIELNDLTYFLPDLKGIRKLL